MSESRDDATDWALAVAGEGEAFGRIFDRHHPRVWRHSSRLVALPDVDDVVAVTFFEAWRKRDRVRLVDRSVLPWLLVTATNTSRNLNRGLRRYSALLAQLPPATSAPPPEAVIETGETQDALRTLALADQRVIALCVLEGLSEREAAEVLGVPAGTVKSRLSRAKERLRRATGAADLRTTSVRGLS